MAEDITLKGVKVIRYNGEKTGDFSLVRPKRGGDTHMLPKWWDLSANNKVYLDCTVLEVGAYHLVIPTQMQSEVRIVWDGTDINFISWRGIERAALFPAGDYGAANVVTDFIFPAIAVRSAKVAAVDGPGSVAPPAPPATNIGTVTVTGEASPADGNTEVYSVSISGNAPAGSLSYSWSADGTGSVSAGGSTASASVTFTGAGASQISCTVTSSDPGITDDGQSGSLNVTSA